MKRLITLFLVLILASINFTCNAGVLGRTASVAARMAYKVGKNGVKHAAKYAKTSPIKITSGMAEGAASTPATSRYFTIAIKQPSTTAILVGVATISGYVTWRIVRTMHGYEEQVKKLTKEIQANKKVSVSVIRRSIEKAFPDSKVSISPSQPRYSKPGWEKELDAMYGR